MSSGRWAKNEGRVGITMSTTKQQWAQRTGVQHQMAHMLFGYWVSHALRGYLPVRAGFCHITQEAWCARY
jgi:hypothetical protein